jgi:hypothetical protein
MRNLFHFILALALGAALVLAVQWAHDLYQLRQVALSETAIIQACDQAELNQE